MLNPLIDRLADYPFDRLRALLQGLQPPEGLRPYVLSVGEPRHAPPSIVAEALALRADDWGRYPPVEGTPDFRGAVVDWLTRRYRLPPGLLDPEREVLPVSGTREALFLIAQAVVPDEKHGSAPAVLMPNPFYQVYFAAAVFGRAEPVFLPATSSGSYDLSCLDVALLDRTAIMYLCSPANPQGVVASLESLEIAVELARAHDFVLCVDECYTDIYDRVPPPGALEVCAELGKSLDVIVFHSLSKRSNVPGLRSGFVAGDARLIRAFRRLRAFGGASVPLPVLHASSLLWRDDAHAEANRSLYRAKFDLAERLLAERFGFVRPAGGFFVWLQVGDGEQAARALWSRAALRVLPGAYLARPSRDGEPGSGLHPDCPRRRPGQHERCFKKASQSPITEHLLLPELSTVMIRTSTLAILPLGAIDYLKKRAAELSGLVLFSAGLALFLALASFDPSDPSLNHATATQPANLLGWPGADIADLLLHGFGWAALVPVLGLFGWAWRAIGKRPMRGLVPQSFALCLAMILLSLAMAAVPPVPGWPIAAGFGGAIGSVLSARIAAATLHLPLLAHFSIAVLACVVGIGALGFGMGVSIADWRLFGRTIRDGGLRMRATTMQVCALAARTGLAVRSRDRFLGELPIGGAQPAGTRKNDLVDPKPVRMRSGRKGGEAAQGALDFEAPPKYRLPPLDLLQPPAPPVLGETVNRNALEQNARMLKTVLDDFGVRGEIVKVRPGPVITLYELEPAPGTKSARVIALADDIARSMSAISARVAVIPGRNVIGIELPNQRREAVGLRELLASDALERSGGALTLALGKDIGGGPVLVDLARMPHLLIAGTTGSGKSVAINAMILSLLYRQSPDACKFILVDPKMLELSVYDGIPHLLSPVVTEPGKAVVALKWTVQEMEERYRAMSQLGVRNITGFNARVAEAKKKGETLKRRVQTGFDEDGKPRFEEQELDLVPLPLIVVVVDEMADLMLVAGKDIEAAVQRLSQMARAAGIHLIMATQRPSVDVITGTIKANFPTRISFQVTSKIDSRTILGEQGAEQLLGQGDMLFMAPGGRVTRVHGPFVSDAEVEAVVQSLKAQGEPQYIDAVTEPEDDEDASALMGDDNTESDELYHEAVAIVLHEGKASTSFVQRRLQIGYNRAARLVERMESEGLVSKADRVGRREVLAGDRAAV